VPDVSVRLARPSDAERLAGLFVSLWSHVTLEEEIRTLQLILAGETPGTLPLALFVAEDAGGALTGFVEVSLRSHADGCDPARPVGFLEGWYVVEGWRRRGVGALLVRTAEGWARSLGCVEMASDALIDNDGSHHAHSSLGFEVVDRCVHFRKPL
jgi:aminoglycoside 6'-N-acetyltransferase I